MFCPDAGPAPPNWTPAEPFPNLRSSRSTYGGQRRLGERVVSELLNFLTHHLSDAAILVVSALAFGVLGALMTLVGRAWYAGRSTSEDKQSDTVHTSLLGLAMFLLALSLTSAFSTFSKVEDAAQQEALDISRLDRELAGLGERAADSRAVLASYINRLTTDEWASLSERIPRLSQVAQQDLDSLWSHIRGIQAEAGLSPSIRESLTGVLARLEQSRVARLAAATAMIPNVFWVMIIALVAATNFMSGRHTGRKYSFVLTGVHTAIIGLVVALTVIFDNPFRGETSVHADIISGALKLR